MSGRPTLYPGGFVLADAGRELTWPDDALAERVAAWRTLRVGRYKALLDETWRAAQATAGDAEVLLLGTAMDLDDPGATQQAVVERVAAALADSDAAFLDRVDALVGAHVIVALRGEQHWLLQDATGMEGVAYDIGSSETLVASHPGLVAEIRGYPMSEIGRLWLPETDDPDGRRWRMWAGPWFTPGVSSPFENVRTLTPNTRLDLTSRQVERFWPRGPIGIEDMATVVDRVAGHLTDAYGWVVREHPGRVSVSVSGGLDSRLGLAASRPHQDEVRYFTYYFANNHVHRNDVRIAETLADRFKLEHRSWPLTSARVSAELEQGWERTHRGIHGTGRMEFNHVRNLPPDDIHVRSNVLEVVRGYYIKNPVLREDKYDVARLARIFRVSTAERFIGQLQEYVDVTGFGREAKQDMHFTDLYHWEQRLGRWHSELVRRLKVSHNTFIIWNSRRILGLMLARPDEDRWKARVVYQLIDRLWPETLETAIFSGSRFTAPPPDVGAGPPAFAWARLSPEARLALGRALDPQTPDAEAGGRLLAERAPEPTPALFDEERAVEAALAEWLPGDPTTLDLLYDRRVDEPREKRPASHLDRVQRIDRVRARPAGAPLKEALGAAAAAAGARLPAIATRGVLHPYLRIPTTGLSVLALNAPEEALAEDLRRHGDLPPSGVIEAPLGIDARRPVVRWLIDGAVRGGRRVVWVTQRRELLEQAALAFVDGASCLRERPALVLRLLGGGYGRDAAPLLEDPPDVTVATYSALGRDADSLPALLRGAVVVMEDAGLAAASLGWRAVTEQARRAAGAVIGLLPEALAGAEERDDAAELFGPPLARSPLPAHLADRLEAERVETGVAADAGVEPRLLDALGDADLPPEVAARLAADEGRDALIVEAWLAGRAAERYGQTVAYAIDAAHARALAERFKAAKARAGTLAPGDTDAAVLDSLNGRSLDVLIAVDPLPEGVDLVRADTVLLCRPVRSEALLAELCAGVLRRGPVARVIEIADRWERLSGFLGGGSLLGVAGEEAVAAYRFAVEFALPDDELEVRRHTVAVGPAEAAGYEALEAAAAASPEGLPAQAEELRARFFADVEGAAPADVDLVLIAAYAHAHGTSPARIAPRPAESVHAG
ncbi:MAG TPA: hypothetical protein VF533_17085 [Solirubrobacteraceae bacterium]